MDAKIYDFPRVEHRTAVPDSEVVPPWFRRPSDPDADEEREHRQNFFCLSAAAILALLLVGCVALLVHRFWF
jgi:hypothetical protein